MGLGLGLRSRAQRGTLRLGWGERGRGRTSKAPFASRVTGTILEPTGRPSQEKRTPTSVAGAVRFFLSLLGLEAGIWECRREGVGVRG